MNKVMAKRLGIYLEWCIFGYALFFILNIFFFDFIAFSVSLLITVASFLDNKNKGQHNQLKQPVWELKNNV